MRSTQSPSGDQAAKHIAAEVRAEMARQGLTQQALANKLGCNQPYLSRRMTGAVPFDVAELVELAEALGVPLAQFLPAAEVVR